MVRPVSLPPGWNLEFAAMTLCDGDGGGVADPRVIRFAEDVTPVGSPIVIVDDEGNSRRPRTRDLFLAPGIRRCFIRADANSDAGFDIADAIIILLYLFGQEELNCMDAGDVNDDGAVDIADSIHLLGYLFAAGPPPPPPFPGPQHEETTDACATDPTADRLGCDRYGPCACLQPVDND
jgi:hypothetical protein